MAADQTKNREEEWERKSSQEIQDANDKSASSFVYIMGYTFIVIGVVCIFLAVGITPVILSAGIGAVILSIGKVLDLLYKIKSQIGNKSV